jgi:CheY-like chemotaxis protein
MTILVAEDNVVNQRLAVGILEKRGHTVVVVDNGRKAVEETQAQTFDIVLMDVQMPEMDGLQATAAIRDMEKRTGSHMPIVALTARAITVDRQRCLEAGMDAYITKPFRPQELVATIERLVSPDAGKAAECGATKAATKSAASRPAPVAQPQVDLTGVIDVAALNARVEGDTELLAEMVELFLDSAPRLLEEISAGVEHRDSRAVQLSAHALKGAMQSLGAMPGARAALRLETTGMTGDMSHADDTLIALKEEFDRLIGALNQMTQEVRI